MEVCQRGTQTQTAALKHPSFFFFLFSFSFFELDESEALAEFLTENSSNNCWRGKDKKLVFCSLLIWNNMSCTVCCVCVCVCHPGLFISRAPHKRFQSTRREKSFGASLNFSCQSTHTLPLVSSAVEKQLQVHVCNKLTRENCKIRFSCLLWSHIWWFMTVSDLPLFFYSVCFTIWFVSDVWLWGWSACVHKQVQHLPTAARGCAPTSPCSLQLDVLGLLAACRDI